MKNEDNFKVFLYYSNDKLSISVQQDQKDSKFYERSFVLNRNQNNLNLDRLDEFLNSKSISLLNWTDL